MTDDRWDLADKFTKELSEPCSYIDFHGDGSVCLDGEYYAPELRQIADKLDEITKIKENPDAK